jgi:hypothetical protein
MRSESACHAVTATASAPVRVLAMIANPTDGPPFDAEREWEALRTALAPLISAGQVDLVRLEDGSENALKRRLAGEAWQIVHLIVRGRAQGARYSTLALEGQGRRTRGVTARHLGELLRSASSLRLAVLQACPESEPKPLSEAAALVVEDGFPAAVALMPLAPGAAGDFARVFYATLVTEGSVAQACAQAGETSARTVATLHGRETDRGIFRVPAGAPLPVSAPAPREDPAVAAAAQAEAKARAVKAELERRRAAGAFDVFLCHNSIDKPAVMQIGRQLMARGILPWLDDWELRPGMPWQRLLEDQIAGINAAAVFVGADGLGPWQLQELDAFLRQFVSRKCPVIPVLLTAAPREPKLPIFLQGVTWVDFRRSDVDPLDRLVWGITGRAAPLG